jgi:hypothetical protein
MTLVNHGLVGVAIALTLKEPALVLPLSLGSHFVLDLLPHFGFKDWHHRQRHKKLFEIVTATDILLTALLLVFLAFNFSWIVFAAAFLAVSPDLIWGYRFVIKENFGKNPPGPENFFEQFHKRIQKYEFPAGILVELTVAVLLIWLIDSTLL